MIIDVEMDSLMLRWIKNNSGGPELLHDRRETRGILELDDSCWCVGASGMASSCKVDWSLVAKIGLETLPYESGRESWRFTVDLIMGFNVGEIGCDSFGA
ncbi:hypothetical protein V6N12_025604 [Hibiscus sabdariffa]|uniref:Uncharacterized protein n=1 Tax=Hibiscus sabdariffa TaxID=183260 RepID=A0ABR2CJP3_9ROSI